MGLNLEEVTVRPIKDPDFATLEKWSDEQKWNVRLQDLKIYESLDADGFLVADYCGKIIGEYVII